MEYATLENAKKHMSAVFMRHRVPSVVGVGIGRKIVRNRETRTLCVRVYVDEKAQPLDLDAYSIIPPEVLGAPTDIVAVGRTFRPLARPGMRLRLFRPAAGVGERRKPSLDAPNINPRLSSTFGAVLYEGKNYYILGANHALAVNGRAIFQKLGVCTLDQNEEFSLGAFVPLRPLDELNEVDCALVKLKGKPTPDMAIEETLGRPILAEPQKRNVERIIDPGLAQPTRPTGRIVDVNADIFVDFSFGTFLFTNQVLVEGFGAFAGEGEQDPFTGQDAKDFAREGDSGSIIVDTDRKRAVGMVFAGTGRFTAACPLPVVIEALSKRLRLKTKLKLFSKPQSRKRRPR
ncbi:MAG: hypothetical protein ACRD44_13910 [Bryobacteraceae bacterium]